MFSLVSYNKGYNMYCFLHNLLLSPVIIIPDEDKIIDRSIVQIIIKRKFFYLFEELMQ